MKKILSLAFISLFLFVPVMLVHAQNVPTIGGACSNIQNLDGVVSCVLSVLRIVVYFLFTFAFIYTLYGAFRFIGAEGDSREKWRDVILYGIIGLFVMTAIWGIVGILDGTFNLRKDPISAPQIRVNQGSSGGSSTLDPNETNR